MKEPFVYIIILNWNGFKDTIKCIKSIEKITYKNYEIVVVDNGSTNESVKVLKSKFLKTKLIENKENLGYTGGCNVGIKYALKQGSDYILLLNNDTTVNKNFLQVLINVAESSENIGIVGPKIKYFDTPSIIQSMGGSINCKSLWPITLNKYRQKDNQQNNNTKEVDWISGCCLLIKNQVLKKTGILDNDYFLYVEDVDLNVRVKQSGYKIYVVSNALVWHKGSASSGGEGNLTYDYYNSRNLILFAFKHLHNEERIMFLLNVLRKRVFEIAYFYISKQNRRAHAMLKGVYHGFSNRKGYCHKI